MDWNPRRKGIYQLPFCGSAGKESTCNAGDLGLSLGWEDSPGEGKDYPIQYSGLENPMDYIVHGVAKSWTQLSDFHFHWEIVKDKGAWPAVVHGVAKSQTRLSTDQQQTTIGQLCCFQIFSYPYFYDNS